MMTLALLALTAAPSSGFNAAAAWAEFDEVVRQDYAYFERPGVDGPALLAHFAPQAKAARSPKAFIDVLQVISRNFADPHFIVGPLADEDPSVVPTASDLSAAWVDGKAVVLDVRADSDASRQGVAPGSVVTAIDGVEPSAAVATLLGRPFEQLSAPQRDAGLTIALAGFPRRARVLSLGSTTLTLTPTTELAKRVEASPHLTVERRGAVGLIRFGNSLGHNAVVAEFAAALTQLADTSALVLDLRNTPSGGNTVVARGIMGHFVDADTAYQVHVVPGEAHRFGVPRKFIEYVLPIAPRYRGKVFVLGSRWTGSMGEGLMIGFDAIGATTVGSVLGHLLGGTANEHLARSGAKVDLAEEALFHVNGAPRESFRPTLAVDPCERTSLRDPALERVLEVLKAK